MMTLPRSWRERATGDPAVPHTPGTCAPGVRPLLLRRADVLRLFVPALLASAAQVSLRPRAYADEGDDARPEPDALAGPTLGATKETWLAVAGEPVADPGGGDDFANGASVSWRTVDGQERAWFVSVALGDPAPEDVARQAIRPFHPADAQPVRAYRNTLDLPVEVFFSEALAQVFAGDPLASRALTAQGVVQSPPGLFSEVPSGGDSAGPGAPITATFITLLLGELP